MSDDEADLHPTPPEPPEVVALRAKLDQLERQNADYKSMVAEVQNSGRRVKEDAEKQKKYAAEALCRDLLAVFDNLDRSLTEAKKAEAGGPLLEGVTATLTQFVETLKRHGVAKIETAENSTFDPHLHMAVMQQKAEGVTPGHIARVLQHGFLFHERVLRPATVIVASE